jgi:hypothetical protein
MLDTKLMLIFLYTVKMYMLIIYEPTRIRVVLLQEHDTKTWQYNLVCISLQLEMEVHIESQHHGLGNFLSLLTPEAGRAHLTGEAAIDASAGAMEDLAALLSSLGGSARQKRNWALSPAPFPSTAVPNPSRR